MEGRVAVFPRGHAGLLQVRTAMPRIYCATRVQLNREPQTDFGHLSALITCRPLDSVKKDGITLVQVGHNTRGHVRLASRPDRYIYN